MHLAITNKSHFLIPAILVRTLIIVLLGASGVCAQEGASVIRGRVIYADSNRPLRRAEVTLYDTETGGAWRSSVPSDRRGSFTFEKVPAGRYVVIAEAPGIISPLALLGRSDSLITKIMLGEIKDGFSEVSVDGKGRAETEVRVRRGGVITGRVTADDDEPVAEADVKLFRRERGRFVKVESTWRVLDQEKRALQTDARGSYRIAGLPAGEYVVRVSEAQIGTDGIGDETEAYGDGSLVIAYYPSATNLKDAQAITVLEGNESTGIDVRMPTRDTHKLAGTVTVGRDDSPAGFVEIKIDRVDEGLSRTSLTDVHARTDNDGEWEVNGIPDGEYIVMVGSGIGSTAISTKSSSWVRIAPRRFNVKVAGTDLTSLEVRLAEGARISGKVVAEGSMSLSNRFLRVEIIPATDVNETQSSATSTPQHTASSRNEKALAEKDDEVVDRAFVQEGSGTFEMDTIPAGRYYLRLRGIAGDSFYVKAVTRGGADLMRSSFRIDEGQSLAGVQITLATDVATVEGRATSRAATSKPSSTVVLLMPVDETGRRFIDGLIIARADDLGRFTLKAPPGEYVIAALTRQQSGKEPAPINEDSLIKDRSKFRRITLRPGERVKAVDVSVMTDEGK